ncbi:MAG: TrmH family RNA methyltransferase [Sciscionella sp.]
MSPRHPTTPTRRSGEAPFTERTSRVVAAGRLRRRAGRESAGRFLAEGVQAVREALEWAAAGSGAVHELFVTSAAAERDPRLPQRAAELGIAVSEVTERAAAGLSETVTPQGIVAVCDRFDQPLDAVLSPSARLVVVLVGVADPGNAGSVIRVADAAGVDVVLLAGDTVDPHNGKCVRASTGSIFHLPMATIRDPAAALHACRGAGLRVLGADRHAEAELDEQRDRLAKPTAWVFGSEAHGLPEEALRLVDDVLRVPIYGAAESLNLATAAALCLYASASAQRSS